MEYTLSITNLTCGACIKVCTMILKKIDSVETVNIGEDGATRITSTKPLDMDQVRKALKEKGYETVITS